MKAIKLIIVLFLSALFSAGCTSSRVTQNDLYNQPESQRERSKQAQDELSIEISRERQQN